MNAHLRETITPMIKAIIFDADGTLIATVHLHAACWVEALKHFSVDVPSTASGSRSARATTRSCADFFPDLTRRIGS
jgi:beta-phosphoglucomutase-like phosphatase (HAD superfamily)